ncbi:hypothetical protein [Nocardia carnea]|uniref:hypothetical protein n=1 Tax=Nocardia carnea TaxID=37328 RepID=UPI002457CE3E|nr:hypothetical protein [Nocardia carnea]
MTEDGGHGADGVTVDSVTGLLASRLGAVGESAGEVMRRDVRTAAGGAESVVLLVQADSDGADRLSAQLPGVPGHIAGSAGIGTVPDGSPEPQRNPSDRPPIGPDGPAAPESDDDAGQAAAPGTEKTGVPDGGKAPTGDDSALEREAETPASAAAGVPGSERTEPTTQAGSSGGPAAPEKVGLPAAEAPAADPAQTGGRAAAADAGPPPPAPGQTPWTPDPPGSGLEPGRNQVPGATPWNTGANSSMPYMPSLPGGLPGSLTPQERPPRGNPPWSRGRGGGTVFPRARPAERPSGRMD